MSAATFAPSTARSESMIPSEYGSAAPTVAEVAPEQVRDDDVTALVHRARSSARARSFSFANWIVSYTPWKTLCTSAPASTRSAASRSAFGVVFEYWKRPVSVTMAT